MKDNSYMNAMNSIKAPENLIDDAVQNIKEAETSSELTVVEKPKRRVLKFTSAVAAVLALIIGLSFIPMGGKNKTDSEHNFVISVGAAEITPETYMKIGFMESSFESGTFLIDQQTGEYIVINANKEFSVDIQCSGENIESITYTPNNGFLQYSPNFNGLISAVKLTAEEVEKYDTGASSNGSLQAASCTFDYYNQPRSLWNPEVTGFEIPEDSIDGTIPLRVGYSISFDSEEHVVVPYVDGFADSDDVFVREFNAHADEYTLDITANFADGTQVTKTLKFICDDSMSQLQLLVTEVIV